MRTLLEGGSFFEGPRWHDGRWWVSDFFRHVVLAVDEDGHAEETARVEAQPSGLGWLSDGSLLVVSMRDRRVLRLVDGRFELHADLAELCDWHANDMVVASDGRAFVGNIGFDLEGSEPKATSLVRVDPDGSASIAAGELMCPNGSVITPDGRTLIVGETFAARYTAFTIADDGALVDRRTWADLRSARIAPDGCALDAEGCIWSADARHNRCCRIAEGGAVVSEVELPAELRCFACMLGGDDGRTLLLCGAPDYDTRQRSESRDAVLLTTRVDAPHAGLP
jgi:sugar lactone lactonase YvrE